MGKELTREDHRKIKEEVKAEMEEVRKEDKRTFLSDEKRGLIRKTKDLLYWLYTE